MAGTLESKAVKTENLTVSEAPKWKKDLETGWTTGDEKDPSQVYVHVDIGNYVWLPEPFGGVFNSRMITFGSDVQTEPVVTLFSIHVPEAERKKGIASTIVAALEQRANSELKRRLAIGPLVGETSALVKIAKKRSYLFAPPFMLIQSALPTAVASAQSTST